jgi:hypothetical protein
MAELRYKGALVERYQGPTAMTDAQAYAAQRAEQGWTVEFDRPVSLRCNGALMETFATSALALAYRDASIAKALASQDNQPAAMMRMLSKLPMKVVSNPSAWTLEA